jgi:O-methyltransferase
VPGDFIECGAWRGGATIFMRAVLKCRGVTDRRVWVADSFEGLPTPKPEKFPADAEVSAKAAGMMAVSLEQVQENFRRYGLLDDRVQFLKGWFSETLPKAPIERLAVLRVDGDMYESTMDALNSMYPKLAVGGYVIIDDMSLEPCRKAVADYRSAHHITTEIRRIDWTGVYWKREPGQ